VRLQARGAGLVVSAPAGQAEPARHALRRGRR
jgi:hypothetical protein